MRRNALWEKMKSPVEMTNRLGAQSRSLVWCWPKSGYIGGTENQGAGGGNQEQQRRAPKLATLRVVGRSLRKGGFSGTERGF